MTGEEAIQELQICKWLIQQDGQDYLDERDIPLLDKAIEALKATTDGDTISRQAALDAIGYDIEETHEIIKSLPSAEPKTGKWKHLKGDEWLCSNCGYVVCTEGSWEHPLERGKDYCEHCGAKMRDEEE